MGKNILKTFLVLVLVHSTLYAALTKTEVSMLYVSLFNRASEGEGSRYWQSRDLSMEDTVTEMLLTSDAQSYFGTTLNSNEAFIEHIYKNTLNKTKSEDEEGILFWVNLLNNGKTRAETVVAFIGAINNPLNAGAAQNQFNNRVTVSNYMADTVEKAPADYATSMSFSGNLIVTSDRSSVSHAKEQVNLLAYPINKNYLDTFVYDKNSRYKETLKSCAGYIQHSCYLSMLPLIGQENSNPTKELIMSRVVVSHKWMGDRFSEMLDILDGDIKQLLGSVTAIVIDDDIIPAYYWADTGAIYLDPRFLWLTPQEAKTITVKDDYRSGFGNGLKFSEYSRYIKDNNYAYLYSPLDKNITRTKKDIKYNLAGLLYHELAHANDFVPPSLIEGLDSTQSIYNITRQHHEKNMMLSQKLYQESPLESKELIGLGGVLYHGVNATVEQREMNAEEVGLLFGDDKAADMYGYSTIYEDLAMLFDATMMKYHYNIERDQGFIITPTKEEATYKDYIVGWGERNRIANPNVSDRALSIVKSILPVKTDWDDFFANGIGKSQLLIAGKNWWDSRDLSRNANNSQKRMREKVPSIDAIHFQVHKH